MKKLFVILIILLLLFLGWLAWHCKGDVACMKAFFQSAPTATPTATFSPTATLKPGAPPPPPPTRTKTPTPTHTLTSTHTPTLSPSPSLSPTHTRTFTRTFTKTYTCTFTYTFTPSMTLTPTHTFTFTPICTARTSSAPVKEAEPNENETEATALGPIAEGGDLAAVGYISRIGASGDHDVFRVDGSGFVALLDCFTFVSGPPEPGDQDFRLNAYDILFRPISLPAAASGPVQVADLRQAVGKTFYLEVVAAGGRPGRYRLTVKK
jgi:hypothetical protein